MQEQRPWYRTITSEQWKALVAAKLGYMLDAMDFVLYLMAITELKREFELDRGTAGLLATIALLTSAVGGVVFGMAADRFGRTRALTATILIYSFCSLGTATSRTLWELMVWRALLGLGVGGEWSAGAVLVSETWPAAHRGRAIGIMQSGWALGYLLAAVVAALVLPTLGWRWLFAVGALPALLVFWVRRAVREPAVWLEQRGAAPAAVHPLRAIFGPGLLGRTVLATLLTAAVMFAYWGFFTWLPNYLASPVQDGGAGMGVVQSMSWIVPVQIGAYLGYLSFGFLAHRLGRKRTFIGFLAIAAVLVPLYGQLSHSPALLLALGPLVGFFGHGYFSIFGSMLAELYPTSVRATGQGFSYGAGRGLSALAPFTIGALADRAGIGSALALTSAFFLLGAALVVLVPAAEGRELKGET
jgi:MFS family permease